MAKSSSKKTQILMFIVGLSLLGLLLWGKRDALTETFDTIKNANLWLVFLLPVMQFFNYLTIGNYYQSMLGLFNVKMGIVRIWGVVAALEFVGQILPSGGVSGLAYLMYGFRGKASAGVVGLIQLGRYILSLTGYFLLAPFVLVMIMLSGQTEWLQDTFYRAFHSTYALGFIFGFAVIGIITLLIFRIKTKDGRFSSKLERFINSLATFVRRRPTELVKPGAIVKSMKDFHDGVDQLKKYRLKMLKPIGFMFMNTLFSLAMVYVAFQAINSDVSIGVLFISYIAAQVAGVVSVIPGDVGVHEGIMIIMLSSLGVSDADAISATLLYRLLNKMIYLPIGFIFYTRLLNPKKA